MRTMVQLYAHGQAQQSNRGGKQADCYKWDFPFGFGHSWRLQIRSLRDPDVANELAVTA